MNEEISDHMHIANDNLKRIADALDLIIKMVKEDQERSRKGWEYKPEEKENEQTTRASNGPRLPAACSLVRGPGTELQATSHKLQASGCKLDKIKL